MIPILYDALEKDFSTNGIGLLTDAESCIVTEERNGIYELVLTYPAKGHLADHITEDMIIKAKANDEDKPQLFRIYKSGKAIGSNITWYAEHVRYELNGNPIENFKISGANADMALRTILGMAVLPHDFTSTSDIQTANSTEIEGVVSVGNALGGTAGSILDVWGGEYHFDNYKIELKKQRGQDNGVTIEYGKNLIDAKQEKNIADIATVIFPYSKYQPAGEDQEKYISLTEKILIHKDVKNFATMRCTIVDFSKEWESGTIVTEDMLRKKATEYLNKMSTEPKISITLSFAALKKTKDYKNLQAFENVKLCDTVTVKILPLGISAKAKITKVKYDSIKERYESLEIGETRTNLTKSITAVEKETKELIIRNQTRTEKIKAEIEKTIKNVTEAITGNSGGHVVLYPSQNPQEIMILDKENINEAKNVWRWNLAGLGHSRTGVNGTFTTAITADGQIVANFITTGELTGAIIKAGTVAAEALDVEYRESVKKYSQETANAALSSAKEDTTNRLKSYSTTVQMNAAIKTTADAITQTVSKKVGTDEIISKINQTAETITINASKIDFNGMITANNRFKILSDGSFEANYGKIANWDVRSDYIESRSVGGVTTKLYANGSIAFGDCTISTYGGAFTIRNGLHIYTSTNTVNGFDDGTERFKVYGLEHVTSGGHLVFGSDGATVSYLSSSSKRYKDHVKDMAIEEAEKILEVPVVWFKYKEGYLNATDWLNGKELPGFYAEDIYNIFPQATQLNENGEPEDWNYRVLIPAMLKLIQELYKEKEQKG